MDIVEMSDRLEELLSSLGPNSPLGWQEGPCQADLERLHDLMQVYPVPPLSIRPGHGGEAAPLSSSTPDPDPREPGTHGSMFRMGIPSRPFTRALAQALTSWVSHGCFPYPAIEHAAPPPGLSELPSRPATIDALDAWAYQIRRLVDGIAPLPEDRGEDPIMGQICNSPRMQPTVRKDVRSHPIAVGSLDCDDVTGLEGIIADILCNQQAVFALLGCR